MATNPFPLPAGPRADWTAADWQQKANRDWFEIMAVDRDQPNYRPALSMLEASHAHSTRKARQLRAAARESA